MNIPPGNMNLHCQAYSSRGDSTQQLAAILNGNSKACVTPMKSSVPQYGAIEWLFSWCITANPLAQDRICPGKSACRKESGRVVLEERSQGNARTVLVLGCWR